MALNWEKYGECADRGSHIFEMRDHRLGVCTHCGFWLDLLTGATNPPQEYGPTG